MKHISRFAVLDMHEDVQVVASAWTMDEAKKKAKAYAKEAPECQLYIRIRTYYEDGQRHSELAGVPDSERWEDGFEARYAELAAVKPWLVREEDEHAGGA